MHMPNAIFHRVPENFRGDAIIPGNQLPDDLRAAALAKYRGREVLMRKPVPPLGCLWNDAIQNLAAHPSRIKRLMRDCGFVRGAAVAERWFVIPLERLDLAKAAVYLYDESLDRICLGAPPAEWLYLADPLSRFETFRERDLPRYATIPALTAEYYRYVMSRRRAGWDTPLFPFQFVPHVFYRGAIPVAGLSVIEVSA